MTEDIRRFDQGNDKYHPHWYDSDPDPDDQVDLMVNVAMLRRWRQNAVKAADLVRGEYQDNTRMTPLRRRYLILAMLGNMAEKIDLVLEKLQDPCPKDGDLVENILDGIMSKKKEDEGYGR